MNRFYLAICFLLLYPGCCNDRGKNDIIFENGHYFNGTKFVPFGELRICGDKIAGIDTIRSKRSGRRVSVKGMYIIPGLVDAHVHLMGCPGQSLLTCDPRNNASECLNYGVITVIDLFFSEDSFSKFKKVTSDSPQYYPTVLMAGPILTAPKGHGTEYNIAARAIASANEGASITNAVIDKGVDIVKLVYQHYSAKHALPKDVLDTIVSVAHKRNKKVFAHINSVRDALDCINAGVDVLAHMPADSLTDADIVRLKKSRVVVIPTLIVLDSFLKNNPELSPNVRINLKKCIDAEIPIVAGTDAGNPGVFFGSSLHAELIQYKAAGMSAAEALRTATQNVASIFPSLKIGRISQGYDADLVILRHNPLSDMKNIRSIVMVMHKGRIIEKKRQ